MKIRDMFKYAVDMIAEIPKRYEKSMNDFHREIQKLPPNVQTSVYASMYIRR